MRHRWPTSEERLPSYGALLLRAIVAVALVVHCVQLRNSASVYTLPPLVIAAVTGLFLLFGAWTPVAGATVVIIELVIAFSNHSDPWASLLLAGLGVSLALLGPGAWSVDARRFGLKRIVIRPPDN